MRISRRIVIFLRNQILHLEDISNKLQGWGYGMISAKRERLKRPDKPYENLNQFLPITSLLPCNIILPIPSSTAATTNMNTGTTTSTTSSSTGFWFAKWQQQRKQISYLRLLLTDNDSSHIILSSANFSNGYLTQSTSIVDYYFSYSS